EVPARHHRGCVREGAGLADGGQDRARTRTRQRGPELDGRGGGVKRTLWGVLLDENWSMDVYDTREEAQQHRTYKEVLPLVKITEEAEDYGDWTDLAVSGNREAAPPAHGAAK